MSGFIAKDISTSRVGGDLIAIVLAHIFMIYHGGARLKNRLPVGSVRRDASIKEAVLAFFSSWIERNVQLKANRTAPGPGTHRSPYATTRPSHGIARDGAQDTCITASL
jgi:hypothetical protein